VAPVPTAEARTEARTEARAAGAEPGTARAELGISGTAGAEPGTAGAEPGTARTEAGAEGAPTPVPPHLVEHRVPHLWLLLVDALTIYR
jgi:hypothetical protein